MRRLLIKATIGIGAAFLLSLAVITCAIAWNPKPESGSHLKRLYWLPSTADDISYYERKGFGWIKAAEFSITREDFYTYAKENNWVLEERDYIILPLSNLTTLSEIDGFTKGTTGPVQYYESVNPNHGGLRIAFNPAEQRCYYLATHR